MALRIRLPARTRPRLALAAVGVCAIGAAAVLAWPGGNGPSVELVNAATAPEPALAGFSAQRLAGGLGAEYGFRFMAATAPTDRGSVDMATARDSAGDHLSVIVFGRAPDPVHGLACEFTPAQPNGEATATASAAGFLAACARLGSGPAQASAAAGWVARSQARLAALPAARTDSGPLSAQAGFATVGYAVRRLPQTGEWIVSMTGTAP